MVCSVINKVFVANIYSVEWEQHLKHIMNYIRNIGSV